MTTTNEEWLDVYTVIEAENKPDFWLKIGRMFPHKNGDGGYNIMLNALPIGNKMVAKPKRKREDASEDNE